MAFQRGGIQLIVGNVGGFLRNIGKANKAYDQMNKAAGNAAKQVTRHGDKMTAASRRVTAAQNNQQKAALNLVNAQKNLELAIRKLTKEEKKGEEASRDYLITLDTLAEIAENNVTKAILTLANADDRLVGAEEAAANAAQEHADSMAAGVAAGTRLAPILTALGVAAAALAIGLGAAAIAWKGFVKGVNLAKRALGGLLNLLKGVASRIAGFFSRIAQVALGIGIADIFRNIGNSVRNLIGDLGEAISFFQRLTIQLEALSARDIAKERLIPMSKAFELAGQRARELEAWIKRIAVVTPFTAQEIARTFAMANAMGLSIPISKQLTRAVIDFTSAMGLQEEHMFRIIYNFGQMLAQGKLNGREFRDLANSFVPVWQMMERMAEAAEMDTQAFKELAFEGGIPVEAFFAEFIEMAEEGFPNAAKKMARTLSGVANNIKDFLQIIIGTNILGPVMDEIAEMMATALDKLLSPGVRRASDFLGKTLLGAFRQLVPAVNELFAALGKLAGAFGLPQASAHGFARAIAFAGIALRRLIEAATAWIRNIANNLTQNFDSLSGQARSWGYNLVATFARGMAAAVKLIVQVINAITRIVSWWFKGRSPPRIAPDLDKWGADTITEWFKGWTKFDVSVFSEISDSIESFLRSISHTMGETALVPAILGGRAAVSEALNRVRQGLITVGQAADTIIAKVGRLSSTFRDYIVALFDVAAAQKKVADAAKAVADAQALVDDVSKRIKTTQDELSDVQDKYSDILRDLNNQLRKVTEEYDEQNRLAEIQQAIGTGLLTDAEKERLEMEKRSIELKQNIRDVEEERDVAVDAIEARLDALEAERDAAQARADAFEEAQAAARAELDAAQERLDLAKMIIDEQIKQNDLIQEQIDLLKNLAEAAGGAAGDMEQDFSDLFDIEGLGEEATHFEEDLRLWAEHIQQLEVDQMLKEMEGAVDAFIESLGELAPAFAPLTGEGGAFGLLSEAVGELWSVLEPAEEPIVRLTAGLTKDPSGAERLGAGLKLIADAFSDFPFESFAGMIERVSAALADKDWEKIGDDIASAIDIVGKAAEDLASEDSRIIAAANSFGSFLGSTLQDPVAGPIKWAFEQALDQVGIELPSMGEVVETGFGTIADNITELIDSKGVKWVEVFGLKFGEADNTVTEKMGSMVGNVVVKLAEILLEIDTKGDEWLTSINTTVDTMLGDVGQFLIDLWDDWSETWQDISDFLDDPVGTTVSWLWNDILVPFKDFMAGTLTTAFNTFKNDVLIPFATWWDNLRQKIEDVATWIGNVIDALASLNLSKLLSLLKTGPGGNDNERQFGGVVHRGRGYMVGERGPEWFEPSMTGRIFPNWQTERMLASPVMAQQGNTYITNIEMNPSYANMQSEASVFYDVTAALSAASR